MTKKGLIAIFSTFCAFVMIFVSTIVVLASGTQKLGSDISIIYVATEISGSVSATYQVGSTEAVSMTDSSGKTTITFASDQAETYSLLSPSGTISLTEAVDIIFTYTFTNSGEEYKATVSYEDAKGSTLENMTLWYKTASAEEYSQTSSAITVPNKGSASYMVKLSITRKYFDGSLNGKIVWKLEK